MNLLLSAHAAGQQPFERGQGLLDGPHWCGTYACADGQFITVQALEPLFNALLFARLGLGDDPEFGRPYDPRCWVAAACPHGGACSLTEPRAHWVNLLEGSDACFAAGAHAARVHGPSAHGSAWCAASERAGVLPAAPAPRFSGTPAAVPGTVARRGEHGADILRAAGLNQEEIEQLLPGG